MTRDERWIQKSVKNKGALRNYIKRKYGKRGFDSKGRIKVELLRKLAKRKDIIGRRARLALTLRKLRKRKKK